MGTAETGTITDGSISSRAARSATAKSTSDLKAGSITFVLALVAGTDEAADVSCPPTVVAVASLLTLVEACVGAGVTTTGVLLGAPAVDVVGASGDDVETPSSLPQAASATVRTSTAQAAPVHRRPTTIRRA
jgi:hypothetical protein